MGKTRYSMRWISYQSTQIKDIHLGPPVRREKFRGIITLLPAILLFLSLSGAVTAHPPSAVTPAYSQETGEIVVMVQHPVGDPKTHYIKSVEVLKEGVPFMSRSYSLQTGNPESEYRLLVSGSPGERLTVIATCNIYGATRGELEIPVALQGKGVPPQQTEGAKTGDQGSLWPFHALLMVTGVILAGITIALPVWGRKPGWYRYHKILGFTGCAFVVIGLVMAYIMVMVGGGPHFRVLHGTLGLILIILLLLVLGLGVFKEYGKTHALLLRQSHLWLGRGTFVVLIITIALGVALVQMR